jgi:hypothetical protein
MRRPPIVAALVLLACVALLEMPISARRAITLVDDAYSPAPADNNTITLTNVQAGDVIAVVGVSLNSAQDIAYTDEDGSTYNDCPSGMIDNAGDAVRMRGAYAVAAGAVTTLTITSSGAASTAGGAVVYRGFGTPTCDASDSESEDEGTTHGEGISVAPTTTNDTLMLGGLGVEANMTLSSGASGYTEVGTTLARLYAAYKVVNSTSANGFQTVTDPGQETITILMAIKSDVAAAAGGCGRFSLLGVGC